MRQLLLIIAVSIVPGYAQRGNRFPFIGLPPVHPIPPLISDRLGAHRQPGHSPWHRPGHRPGFIPSQLPYYSDLSFYPQSPLTNVVIVQATASEAKPLPVPERETRPEVRKYDWTHEPAETTAAPFFRVALRDGSVHQVLMIWRQDGGLCLLTEKTETLRVPEQAVDRTLTRRLNPNRNLDWIFP